MEINTREFGLFIDGLRIDKNISRESLCDGIMSLSQYKRYLKGTTSIPNDKLVLIADRLNFSISEIHTLYNNQYNRQHNKILEVFKLVKRNDFKQAYGKALKIQAETIISYANKLFLDYCILKCQYHLNIASKIQALSTYSNMIDYPDSIETRTFNRTELAILIEIIQISASMENFEPTNFLYESIMNNNLNFIITEDRSFVPSMFSTLALLLFNQGKDQAVIDITDKGIEYCLTYETSNALSHLFIYNSFANYNLENIEQALLSAKKSFMHLYIENKPDKLEYFKKVFEKKFEMSLDELIQL